MKATPVGVPKAGRRHGRGGPRSRCRNEGHARRRGEVGVHRARLGDHDGAATKASVGVAKDGRQPDGGAAGDGAATKATPVGVAKALDCGGDGMCLRGPQWRPRPSAGRSIYIHVDDPAEITAAQ